MSAGRGRRRWGRWARAGAAAAGLTALAVRWGGLLALLVGLCGVVLVTGRAAARLAAVMATPNRYFPVPPRKRPPPERIQSEPQ